MDGGHRSSSGCRPFSVFSYLKASSSRSCDGCSITQVLTKSIIHAPADAVWQALSAFGAACQYLFMVLDCTVVGAGVGALRAGVGALRAGVGALRTLTSADRSTIVQRLETLDEASYRLSYALLTDTPFRDCLTTVTVHDRGQGRCEVTWAATFDADGLPASEAQEMLEGAFGLNGQALQHFLAAQDVVAD
jgi:hypothetical protein